MNENEKIDIVDKTLSAISEANLKLNEKLKLNFNRLEDIIYNLDGSSGINPELNDKKHDEIPSFGVINDLQSITLNNIILANKIKESINYISSLLGNEDILIDVDNNLFNLK